ncbi:hypothetical protein AEM42_03295 [Betaproteobacteria bacterium UKL13-2]|nr:hypothetical protein AEM42_03295 [Betaproteobacteria bacterium UKL13-2]
MFAKYVREEGAFLSPAMATTVPSDLSSDLPSDHPRASVQPASTAKEKRAKLVCQSPSRNVLRRRGRPMKYSG